MSYDPNSPPMGHLPPQKSGGKLKWILGGLGCFGLLTVLCVGGTVWWLYSLGEGLILNNPAKNQAIATIEQSESIADEFGNPVSVVITAPPETQQKGQGELVLIFNGDVTGSEKSGTASIVVKVANPLDADSSTVESITVKDAEGNEIPVEKLDLGIDLEEGEIDPQDTN